MPLDNPTAAMEINTGQYTGDSTANRAIAHGLSKVPSIVIINDYTGTRLYHINKERARINFVYVTASGNYAVTAPDSTNFYVGNATSYPDSGNMTAYVFDWVAIG